MVHRHRSIATNPPGTKSDAASSARQRVVRRIGNGDHRITVHFRQLEQTIDLDHLRRAH